VRDGRPEQGKRHQDQLDSLVRGVSEHHVPGPEFTDGNGRADVRTAVRAFTVSVRSEGKRLFVPDQREARVALLFNSTGDCMNLKLKAKCSGVLEPDNVTPTSTPGWKLATVSRATLNDPDNGDMTVINFPVIISFPPPVKGKMSFSTDTNHVLNGLGLASLPSCTQVEVVSLTVQDPASNPFAKIGAGTRPKGTP
jgi:hypothetical protein